MAAIATQIAPPYRLNAMFAAIIVANASLMLLIVPLALLPNMPLLAGVAVAVLALATPFNTAVLHEAIHGRLNGRPATNDRMGRIIGICSGVSFDIVRFGHLAHHRSNRHALDRPDVIEPGQSTLSAGLRYYGHLFGGLYVTEVLATVLMLLPRRAIIALIKRAMASEEPEVIAIRIAAIRVLERRHRRIIVDALCALTLYAIAFALYGAWWPLLLMGMLLRGFIISVQDNLPHYGTPAVINASAHNTSAPRWMTMFFLNQNLHAIHHDRPDLHWTELPGAFSAAHGRYTDRYFALLLRQFRGPRRQNLTAPAE